MSLTCGFLQMALKLPLDILVDILSVADQATAARLMRTCKYLQKQGERLILRNPCLWFGVSAEGFVRYMLSDLRSRLPLLRGIRLEMRTHSRSSSERLRELFIKLRTSPEFVSLSILHPEWLLYDEVGLSSAIAALAHLKRLELWNVGPNTVGMLHGMCSRLVKVTLSFHNQWPNGGQPDVAQLFRGSQKTLEELEVWLAGPTTSHKYGDHSAAAYAVCYPRMRSLTIVQSPFELHTADYVRVYPNLKHLTIRKPLAYPLREVNLPGPPSDMDAYAPWPRLRSVEGSVKTLYGLALPCNVSTVSINDFDHQDNFDLFRTVLADTQPVHLKLNIHSAKAWQEIYEHALKKMQLPQLRSLSVKIVLTSVDMEVDVKRWLVSEAARPPKLCDRS